MGHPGDPQEQHDGGKEVIPNGPERPDHPTPKPLELFETPMRQHTIPGEVCYEPFAGSGTQIIAAERLARRCFAIEVSPHYCDVIVRRWIHLVGEARAGRALATRYRPPTPTTTTSIPPTPPAPNTAAGPTATRARSIPARGPSTASPLTPMPLTCSAEASNPNRGPRGTRRKRLLWRDTR